MDKLLKTLFFALFPVFLSSCGPATPTEFGMSPAQFNQLTQAQQQAVITHYNQQQVEKQQLDSMYDDLGELVSMIPANHSKTISSSSSSHVSPWSCSNGTCSQSSSSSSSSFGVNY